MKQLIHGWRASVALWMHGSQYSAINFYASFRASIFDRRTLTLNQLLNTILPNNQKSNAFLDQDVTSYGFRNYSVVYRTFGIQSNSRKIPFSHFDSIHLFSLSPCHNSHSTTKNCQKTLPYPISHQHLHPDVTGAITRVSISCNLNKEFDTVKTLNQQTFFI